MAGKKNCPEEVLSNKDDDGTLFDHLIRSASSVLGDEERSGPLGRGARTGFDEPLDALPATFPPIGGQRGSTGRMHPRNG